MRVTRVIIFLACAGLLFGCGSSGERSANTGQTGLQSTADSTPTPPKSPGTARRSVTRNTHKRRDDRAIRRLIKRGRPIYCGGGRGNAVALTFDDGPGPYTHFALKRLRRNHMRATFFLVARNLPTFGSLVTGEKQVGVIGDHTRTHPFLPALSAGAQKTEIVGAQLAIARVAHRRVQLFRPPYGGRNKQIDALVRSHGMLEILWNVDSADSLGANHHQILENVIAAMHPGSIILMHENRGQTIRALPPILHALHRKHLRAVTVPELLATDPPSAKQALKGLAGCPAYREVGNILTAGTPHPL